MNTETLLKEVEKLRSIRPDLLENKLSRKQKFQLIENLYRTNELKAQLTQRYFDLSEEVMWLEDVKENLGDEYYVHMMVIINKRLSKIKSELKLLKESGVVEK